MRMRCGKFRNWLFLINRPHACPSARDHYKQPTDRTPKFSLVAKPKYITAVDWQSRTKYEPNVCHPFFQLSCQSK